MIRQICSIKPEDVATVRSSELLAKLELEDLDLICRERRLERKLTTVDPQERSTWRLGVRSVMCAASQLPGKGPTDVDDAPAC